MCLRTLLSPLLTLPELELEMGFGYSASFTSFWVQAIKVSTFIEVSIRTPQDHRGVSASGNEVKRFLFRDSPFKKLVYC